MRRALVPSVKGLFKHSPAPGAGSFQCYSIRPCHFKPVIRITAAIMQQPQQRHNLATMADPKQFMRTSGQTDSVWVHTEPYSNRPQYPKLTQNIKTDVCIVGSGIAGISAAYELVLRGVEVVMIEARDILSGESGRTSGHLSNALDDGYVEIEKKHGASGAAVAGDSHTWALKRVGEISKKLGIECEYRLLPGYQISQYEKGDPKHDDEIKEIKKEVETAKKYLPSVTFRENYAIQGWDGKVDQRDAAVFGDQATFHPTKYLIGVLKWLSSQPNFKCYTHTRMLSCEEKGHISKEVLITTADKHNIVCNNAIEATCVPLQKLAVIAQMEYLRTYCIAIRVPKGSIEDCLIYDEADPYMYVRFTKCDENDDYLVIGGRDHAVGQEEEEGRFAELERWVRQRFTKAGSVDYQWSGQIFEPVDYMAYIGQNQGDKHIYIVTGDSGNGLTHGVLAGRLLADEIQGVTNPWSKLYNPKRLPPVSTLGHLLSHDLQINTQYKRLLQSDIPDIESLAPGTGGVLNPKTKAPMAVYKDDQGGVHKFSALCPHLKGVVCWNNVEKSWDCPVHASRFSKDGICVMGPSKSGLTPLDQSGEALQQEALAT